MASNDIGGEAKQVLGRNLGNVRMENVNFLKGYKTSLMMLYELQKNVVELGPFEHQFQVNGARIKITKQRARQMFKTTVETLTNYFKRMDKITTKAAKTKRKSGVSGATYAPVSITQSLIDTIAIGMRTVGTRMDELVSMMKGNLWRSFLTGELGPNDNLTGRSVLLSLVHLMFSIYAQKPQQDMPNFVLSNNVFDASKPALDDLERNIQSKRDEFADYIKVNLWFPLKLNGLPVKDPRDKYKSLFEAAVKYYKTINGSEQRSALEDDELVALYPLVRDYENSKNDDPVAFINSFFSKRDGPEDELREPAYNNYRNVENRGDYGDILDNVLAKLVYPFEKNDSERYAMFPNKTVYSLIAEYAERYGDNKALYDKDTGQLTQAGQDFDFNRALLKYIKEWTDYSRTLAKLEQNDIYVDSKKDQMSPEQYEYYMVEIPRESINKMYQLLNEIRSRNGGNEVTLEELDQAVAPIFDDAARRIETLKANRAQSSQQRRASGPRSAAQPIR